MIYSFGKNLGGTRALRCKLFVCGSTDIFVQLYATGKKGLPDWIIQAGFPLQSLPQCKQQKCFDIPY